MGRGWAFAATVAGCLIAGPGLGAPGVAAAVPPPVPSGLSVSHWASGTMLSFHPVGGSRAYRATRHDPTRGSLTVACPVLNSSALWAQCPTGVPTRQGETWTVTSSGGVTSAPGVAAGRTMWVEDIHPATGNTSGWVFPAPPSTIVSNAVALGVSELFMAVPYNALTTQTASYAALITDAGKAGITVDALSGDPSWASDGGAGATGFVNSVIAYNAAHPTDSFSGVHLDIEPWAAATWTTDEAALIRGYLSALQQAASSAHGAGLTVEADITTWLNTVTVPSSTQTLDLAVQGTVDRVTIMSYESGAASQFSYARAELEDLAANGPVRLAADTVPGDPGSYGGTSLDATWAQLAVLDTLVASDGINQTRYLGIALFDSVGTAALSSGAPSHVSLSTAPATLGRTTVTVAVAGGSGTPSGSVSLYQGQKFLGGQFLGTKGTASFVLHLTTVTGLSARYSGDGVYAPATG